MAATYVDLRSDTVTRPSPAMREAMSRAEVGDDVYGEDPTVNRLQEVVAGRLGQEAGLFMASGTMANQVAVGTACRGAEAIVEAESHLFHYEMAAAAARSGIQLYPVRGSGGVLTWADVAPAIRPAVEYLPRTGLIALENTHNRAGGKIYPVEAMAEIGAEARRRDIPVFLDGARLWNAGVATGLPLTAWTEHVDAVTVCFSKGLGAPVGSCLCGPADFIAAARGVRQSFGGAMRQVGIIAAAALYAVENNVERLAEDHHRARRLAEGIGQIAGMDVEPPDTNVVMVDVEEGAGDGASWERTLAEEGVGVHALGPQRIRAVTNLDVDDAGIERAVAVWEKVAGRLRAS
ncbi:MAG: aminotransferase class I/II-fold pyridoxal phosphate-dependent enzyme [Candidatus Coatesbacteria bacterium]|nr:MAG: aminotransferase class I/II-fold pyridoxal phosphate-dependent enzyme [Candidatus Coatesbacteria bacterium]